MSSNKSGRVLAAAALVAALFLAVPVEAFDGGGAAVGSLERLAVWLVKAWIPPGLDDRPDAATETNQSGSSSSNPSTEDEDPEGCRDYTGCVDPNG